MSAEPRKSQVELYHPVVEAVQGFVESGALESGQARASVLMPPQGGQVFILVARDLHPDRLCRCIRDLFRSSLLQAVRHRT